RRPQCLGRAAAPPARAGGCPCAAAAGAAACRRRLPRRGRRPAGRDRGRAGAADGAAGPGCRPCRRGPGRGGLVQGAGRRLATACAGRAAHGARGFFQPGRAVMDAAGSPLRPVCGLLGIFVAATTASLAGRMGALALAALRGALGFGFDAASWLGTAHAAAELIAMPFAAWFAITVSVRRFVLWAIGLSGLAALALPLARSLELMLALRALQGLAGGALIPLLMMAALKFLPPRVKLYGLALYSLTATFASTIAVWLVGVWTDGFADWRLVYWQCVPLLALAAALAGWGLPREPARAARWRQCNWPGLACGAAALGLLAVALDQAVRLDTIHSRLVVFCAYAGLVLLAAYLVTEWRHPDPFLRLRMLSRRNLGLGFTIFFCMLTLVLCASLLPL